MKHAVTVILGVGLALMTGSSAWAGDVWMELDVEDPDGWVHVELPAMPSASADEVTLLKNGQPASWTVEVLGVAGKRVGHRAQYELRFEDGEQVPLVLEHRRAKKGRVSSLDMSVLPSVVMSIPLEQGTGLLALDDGITQIEATHPLPGLDLGSDVLGRVLERAAPTTLFAAGDNDGSKMIIRLQ